MGHVALSVAGPDIWNLLPESLRAVATLAIPVVEVRSKDLYVDLGVWALRLTSLFFSVDRV